MPHVADSKKKIVNDFVKLIKEYPIIGAIDLEGMPTAQLQTMRAVLRDNDVVLLVSKRRLMKIALDKAKEDKKGVDEIKEHLKGMPALIFSKIDSFKLYKLLKQSKSEAPAKPNQTAPKDIVVKAGKTSFMPGPIISELSSVGIKSGVEDGKVAIKEDCVVCKEGDKINMVLAGLLTRLNIKPMEIGLNLVATFEKGVIFKKSVLDIDEEKFLADITKAALESFNLSVETGYFTKENVDVIIQSIFYSCKALAEESGFMADVVLEDMLAGAERSAKSLQAETKVEVKAEEKKPEPKIEEKKEEKPEQPKEEPKIEKPKPIEQPKVEEKPEPKPEPKIAEKKPEPKPAEQPKVEEKKEEKVLEAEKEIIKEEKKLEEPPKEETAPVEKEIQQAVKVEEEKKLEKERIEKEKQLEQIEKPKPVEQPKPETDDKIARMVEAQKKHATGEDKKETAEALVEEINAKKAKNQQEIEEVENIVAQLKKGEPIKPKTDEDEVPSLGDLAKRKKSKL